ncbi:MAG: FAD-dependent oxidoreductase, partial [Romboutsia sp.]|nr:FAD-dependent oxidoreductase [Romboutsia sp.]
PLQMNATLEFKNIEGLYGAGQFNGSSGYEEAAAQGLMAGINASLKLRKKDPLILKRNEAYIGVLIDDLVTKGTIEPYRMLTSRAEYRLLLRHDNADIRLTDYGYKVGLINKERYDNFQNKKANIKELTEYLKQTKITPTKEINEILRKLTSQELKDGISLYNLLKRREITISKLQENKILEKGIEPKNIENEIINRKKELDLLQNDIYDNLKIIMEVFEKQNVISDETINEWKNIQLNLFAHKEVNDNE